MRIVLDTTIVVEIDRKNEDTINLIKKLIAKDHIIIISTATVSEILTGSYLRKDFSKAVLTAKQIMGQFLWTDLDSSVAEKTAQYMAYLITEGKIIEYPDAVIAASFKIEDADYLLTLNKSHFENLPDLKGKVHTPKEFAKIMK
ncbi:MAG: type II toxin-antitoxin system VapC family toxin [Candidatus Aenigmatarchaeota archaeon]